NAFNKNFGTVAGTVMQGNWRPSWADVTGKPTTFAPSTHTHTIAQVTGLQAELDKGTTAFGWGDHAGLYLNYRSLRVNVSADDIRDQGLIGLGTGQNPAGYNYSMLLTSISGIDRFYQIQQGHPN